MKFRLEQEPDNYSDYASGAVFYGAPGQPSFPIRLANEIFQRCLAIRQKDGLAEPCTLYDPCCGGAYHLATLAYFNWEAIHQIIASDIDAQVLTFARHNLALLSLEGMDARLAEIAWLFSLYGKPSHAAALAAGQALRTRLVELLEIHPIETHLFRADATRRGSMLQEVGEKKVDMVITDIPYGRRSAWAFDPSTQEAPEAPIQSMLGSLLEVLSVGAVVAVAASKEVKIAQGGYQQVGKIKVGKRQVVFLRPIRD